MPNTHSNDKTIHVDNSFTELFTLIKKIKASNETIYLDYDLKSISAMLYHADNAMTGIMHGLQGIGVLMAMSKEADKEDILHIGYFISLIANLMEALHVLRLDCEGELMEFVGDSCSG